MSNFIRVGARKVTNAENLSLSRNEAEKFVLGRDTGCAAVKSNPEVLLTDILKFLLLNLLHYLPCVILCLRK